jgi:hypothetical protein
MKSLITLFVSLTLLAGCAAGPTQVTEDTAIVDLSRINLRGDPSGPWAKHHLRLTLGKDRSNFMGGSVAVQAGATLPLRAYAGSHWSTSSFGSYNFTSYSPYRGYYPFDIKAKYGEGNTYTFGPFQPNKCYVAYLEPVSVAPKNESIRSVSGVVVGSRKVRYEFETRADLIDCETIGENDEFDYEIF